MGYICLCIYVHLCIVNNVYIKFVLFTCKFRRLYTESEFEKLETATPAEMCRTDLSSALLLLKALSIDNVLRFSFPSPPPAHNLKCALELLYALGAIDDNGQLTSDLGVQMAEFPLHPMHSKVLLKAGAYMFHFLLHS